MPINSIPSEPKVSEEELERRRQRRDVLAANANQRYGEWRETSVAVQTVSHPHPNDHPFRDRHKLHEHSGEWASADQVLHYRERIRRAVAAAEAAYLRHPPYPKNGGGRKNVEFSHTRAGYDYRAREPSKEVAGEGWSRMRVRPRTESQRVNEAAARSMACDTLGGSRWTIDRKYGNPVGRSPTTTGDVFRQERPASWLRNVSPPPTAPGARKWRGGFVTHVPPRAETPASPIAGQTPWLRHTEAFADELHDTVAVHAARSPTTGRSSFRPVRLKDKELTGGDGGSQFWPQVPSDVYVPNPASTCTWNQPEPSSPLPARAYFKSGRSEASLEGLSSPSGGRELARVNDPA